MRMADAIQQAYNTKWSMANTFTVEFHPAAGLQGGPGSGGVLKSIGDGAQSLMKDVTGKLQLKDDYKILGMSTNKMIDGAGRMIGNLGSSMLSSLIGKKFGTIMGAPSAVGTDINLCIKSITTPDITYSGIEEYIANKWFIHQGRQELYRMSITFRDMDQMKLYREFHRLYASQRVSYFDDVCMEIKIYKDADWHNENNVPFMTFNGTLIESISNISFNNENENEIVEFTVNFKSNAMTVH